MEARDPRYVVPDYSSGRKSIRCSTQTPTGSSPIRAGSFVGQYAEHDLVRVLNDYSTPNDGEEVVRFAWGARLFQRVRP